MWKGTKKKNFKQFPLTSKKNFSLHPPHFFPVLIRPFEILSLSHFFLFCFMLKKLLIRHSVSAIWQNRGKYFFFYSCIHTLKRTSKGGRGESMNALDILCAIHVGEDSNFKREKKFSLHLFSLSRLHLFSWKANARVREQEEEEKEFFCVT
jgi:hypothetical protein